MNETPASCVATIAALIDGSFPAASEYHSPPQPVPAVPLLFDHVTQSRWRDAIHRCMSHPQEADYQDPSSGITALHAACRTPATPPSVIFALLKAYPRASLMHTKHYASTPLHFACWRNLPIEVILMLLSVFPMAAAQENGLGLTPLHLAARTKNVTVVEALLQTFPAAVRSHRVAGYTPLHLAVRGAASAIQQELSSRNSEDASIIETEHNVYGQSSSSLSAALSVVRSMVYEDPSVVGIKDLPFFANQWNRAFALFCIKHDIFITRRRMARSRCSSRIIHWSWTVGLRSLFWFAPPRRLPLLLTTAMELYMQLLETWTVWSPSLSRYWH
jgi:hypothetical protein